jgi:hypothetical protein
MACRMLWRGYPSVSCGAGAGELATTPANMLADAGISAALFVTECWSRPQSYPCCEHVILDFHLLVSSPCAANRLAQVLPCNSTQEAAPANDERKAAAEGLLSRQVLPPQIFPVLLAVPQGREQPPVRACCLPGLRLRRTADQH